MKEEHNTKKESIFIRKPWVASLIFIVVIFGAMIGFLYIQSVRGTVFIENSDLEAPVINLSSSTPGTLNALYVKTGDVIPANTQVALVGTTIVFAKEAGIVSDTPDAIGGYYAPGMTVVSMIKVSDMKVVGQIEENKGLEDVAVGQRATFTVDAFPGRTYNGTVDEVSPTSDDTGIAFSISDQRPTKKFDVRVRFDYTQYPELKNGMSAKITVHTKG